MKYMKKAAPGSRLLVALLCVLLLASSLGFTRGNASDRYEEAINLLQAGKYSQAAPLFKELGHYQDAGEYAMYASALAEAEKGNYALAASTMDALTSVMGTFMDSRLQTIYFTGRDYESRQLYEDARTVYQEIRLFKDVQDRLAKIPELIKQRDYAAADALEQKGDRAAKAEDKRARYNEAKEAFGKLGSYSDSRTRVTQLQNKLYALDYADADKLEKEGKLQEAYAAFVKLGSYSDSPARAAALLERINALAYAEADRLEQQGKLEQALSAFLALKGYADSKARAEAVQEKIYARDYAIADALEKQGKLEEAENAFLALKDYADSKARAEAVHQAILKRDYEAARALEAADDVFGAYDLYVKVGKYLDAEARAASLVPEMNYRTAFSAAEQGYYTKARDAYLKLGSYKDSVEKARLMYIPAISQKTQRVGQGLYAFSMSNKWGLINLNDNQDIRPAWDNVASFNKNGLAIATLGNKQGLINTHGDVVLPLSYYKLVGSSDGYFTASTLNSNKSYTFSLVNPSGKVVSSGWNQLGNSYTSVYRKTTTCYTEAPIFINSTIIAYANQRYALLDNNGRSLIKNQSALSYLKLSTGKYAVTAQDSNDKLYRFYNTDGALLTEDVWKSVGQFTAGFAPVQATNGMWGFIRGTDCQIAIEPIYAEVRAFSENYAAVKTTGSLWGFINTKGEMVIDAKYTSVTDYAGGLSTVRSALLEEHIIDKAGELLFFKENVYDLAANYDATQKYENAIEAFESLNGYADSDNRALLARDKINQQVYARAEKLEKEGKLLDAAETFDWLGDYIDAPQRAAAARETLAANTYDSAAKLEAKGKLEEAIAIYLTLGDYRGAAQHAADLREGINQGILADAAALADKERYEDAVKLLSQIPEYKDVGERIANYEAAIPVRDYNNAAALENAGKFEQAITAFTALKGYSDSADRIDALHEKIRQRDYSAAASLENAGKFEEAITAFTALKGYSDSADRIVTLQEKIKARDYQAANDLEARGEYTRAYDAFTALGSYSDSHVRAKAVAEKAAEQKRQQDYQAALDLKEAGKLNEALAAFKALGTYKNSLDHVALLESNVQVLNYNSATHLLKQERYQEALTAFKALGNYMDSAALAAEAQKGIDYEAAFKQALDGKFKEAYNVFNRLGSFKDSQKKAEITGNLSRAGKSQKIAEGVLIYEFHGLWGIANLKSNVIVPVKYTSISNDAKTEYSKRGLLQVYIGGTENYYTPKYGYIDHNGNEVIPCQYYKITDFNTQGNCTVVKSEYKSWNYYYYFGIMNYRGQTITKPQWRTMGGSYNNDWGDYWYYRYMGINLPTFTNGRMKVQTSSGTWGFIDQNGNVLGSTGWKWIGDFSDGMAVVQNSSGKYTFINEQGKTIGTNTWDQINSFSNGMAAVKKDGKWGFINKQNQLVISCQYSEVKAFQADGTCDVKTTTGTWIIIDKQGKTAFFGK